MDGLAYFEVSVLDLNFVVRIVSASSYLGGGVVPESDAARVWTFNCRVRFLLGNGIYVSADNYDLYYAASDGVLYEIACVKDD